MGKIRLLGVFLLVYAVACFLVNFGFWRPWVFADVAWFWNPFSLLTSKFVGGIPIISGGLTSVVNGVFSVIWSIIMGVVGLILVK